MKKMIFTSFLFAANMLIACGSNDDSSEPTPPIPSGPDPEDKVELTVDPTSLNAEAVEATYEIKVKTTGENWTATTKDNWLKLALENDKSIKVTVATNADAERYGSIKVTSADQEQYIQVTQKGGIRVSAAEVLCTSGAGKAEVTVFESDTWSAEADADWVSVNKEGDKAIASYTENTSLTSRTTTITVSEGGQKCSFKLVQEGAGVTDIPARDGYELVWNDEFNEGSELNKAHWRHEVQNSGWVNNELQNYRDGAVNGKRVTEISDGKLRINCFKGSDGKVYSGRVYAHEGEGWQYGYIEARMMLPKGKGTWPAFWMMPCNVNWNTEGWPRCGEIDIMEEVGVTPNEVSSSLHAQGHNHTNNTQVTHAMTIEKAEGEFHTYAIEWTAKKIITYVDGKVQLEYDNPNTESTKDPMLMWPYDRPYYVILNLAWGGSWGGMNGVDESALPVTMVVDYVRVYQKK